MGARTIARAIWNGPFHIGKLAQPVSVGDVFLKSLETFWRLIVIVVGVIAVAGLWIGVIDPWLHPPLASQISAAVTYDDGTQELPPVVTVVPIGEKAPAEQKPFRCTKDYPLKVSFTNNSSKAIGRINFEIDANYQNYTNNLMPYPPPLDNYRIIKPGYWDQTCWAPPMPSGIDPTSLAYSVKIWFAAPVS